MGFNPPGCPGCGFHFCRCHEPSETEQAEKVEKAKKRKKVKK